MVQAYTGPASTPQAVGLSPACGVIAALNRRRSTTIQLVGDSTGDSFYGGSRNAEWFERLGLNLASRDSDRNVLIRLWNDTNKAYDNPLTLVTGSGGERFTAFATGGLVYSAASIVGDLQLTARVNPTSYATAQTIASKYDPVSNQRGWQWNLASNKLSLIWSADGTATNTALSTVTGPFVDGTPIWVRTTLQINNGGVYTVTHATSPDAVTWTTLGAAINGGAVTSIFNNASTPYQLGSYQGASLTSPFVGKIGWVEIANGINGAIVAPTMPEHWDQASSAATNTILHSGSPNILLVDGSQSGQNIAYFTTNTAKLLTPQGQHLFVLSTGHNEAGNNTGQAWISTLSTYVSSVKAALPGIPIVVIGQNPTFVPAAAGDNTSSLTVNAGANRQQRAVATATWAVSQAGVYSVDLRPAFPDTSALLRSDGLHPNAMGAQAWADYVDAALFQAAA